MKNMKTLRVKMAGLLATALILFSAFRADKPVITIFMIGDSTMANKKIDGREIPNVVGEWYFPDSSPKTYG